MLVTRGQGGNALLPSAGMGAKGSATIVRNQWVRQWAIEQILANQAAADKKELEEKLRENRKKIKQQAPLEVVYTDAPASGQGQGPAKRQRRRRVSRPMTTRAPRHDHSAASREVVAGLFAEQARIKARLAAIEEQVRAATRQAVALFDLTPVRTQPLPYRQWAYAEMARDEQRMLDMFTARAAQKAKQRKQEQEALALMLTLVAA